MLFDCRYSTWMKTQSMLTMDDLMRGFEECITEASLTAVLTETVYNISSWLTPSLSEVIYITKPHRFKITKEGGQAQVYYKMWSTTQVRNEIL